MSAPPSLLARQRGVAVITALLLTTLAITIVASLFWQQQVQVRSIENQRLQLQKQWILRGALDWTQLILRVDGKENDSDNLDEIWAAPLEETRLDQYVENGQADADASDAAIWGNTIDAQSRFNLKNLCPNGAPELKQIKIFAQLLANVKANPALAKATASLMESAQRKPSGTAADEAQPMDIGQVEDLLAVPGFTVEMLNKVKDFVVVLPTPTPVNVNTASAEVLSAAIETMSLSSAAALVADRKRAHYRTMPEFVSRAHLQAGTDTNNLDVKTGYFIVNGNVRLNRASLQVQSLIKRSGSRDNTTVAVLSIREN